MARILFALVLAVIFMVSALAQGTTSVKGSVRRDGKYKAPHFRTKPNSNRLDNWSTRGNVNPYTGRKGTKSPYAAPRSSRRR